jgi:hypothetical protein
MVNAHVDDSQFKTVLTAKHVYSSAAIGEVDHLLPRYVAWRHAHSLALDAVVGTEEQMAWMAESW